MSFDVLSLMGKGLVGVVAIGIVISIYCVLVHFQRYVRRRYPKVDKWGGFITATLLGIAAFFVVLYLLGIVVDHFVWH